VDRNDEIVLAMEAAEKSSLRDAIQLYTNVMSGNKMSTTSYNERSRGRSFAEDSLQNKSNQDLDTYFTQRKNSHIVPGMIAQSSAHTLDNEVDSQRLREILKPKPTKFEINHDMHERNNARWLAKKK
jgi:vacuolar-type H+-ATPase catalytic subunit A/Vma1